MLTVAFCSGVSPSAIGLLSLWMCQVTGFSGLATEKVAVGAGPALEPELLLQAARKAPRLGTAAAVAALLARNVRRLSPPEYGAESLKTWTVWTIGALPSPRGWVRWREEGSLPNAWNVA